MEILFTRTQLDQVVQQFWNAYGDRKVFAFKGEMGAGKTTFVHVLAGLLGVTDAVSSPTYSIINQYITESGNVMYHMDLYRLKDEEEARAAGVEDILESGKICLIEWPERIYDLLPEDTCWIELIHMADGERLLKIQ